MVREPKAPTNVFPDIDLTIVGDESTHSDLFKIGSDIDDLLLPYELNLSLYPMLKYQPLLDVIAQFGKIIFQR